ncbi:hypothetical protein [Clostridium sp. Marseille-QA1073]
MKVKPIYPLVMEFEDGTKKKASFGVETFLLLQEEFGDLTELSEKYEAQPYTLASMILYCGMKVMDLESEYEEAQAIVVGAGMDMVNAIFEKVIESFQVDEEELKKKIQKEVQRLMYAESIRG